MSRHRRRSADDGVFWISYSDLSTAVLAVFILAIASMVQQARAEAQTHESERNALLAKHQQDQEELLAKVEELQKMRDRLASRLRVAKDKANEALGDEVFGFDPLEQRVFVIRKDWFAQGESALAGKAPEALEAFYPHLHDALFKAETESGIRSADFLQSIELQGHTDLAHKQPVDWSWESYADNAGLSRRRAAAIADHLGTTFNSDPGHPWRQFFGLVETSGRSWTQATCEGKRLGPPEFLKLELPCRTQTQEEAARSRRVTFGFRLNDARVLEEIGAVLKARRQKLPNDG